MVNIFIEKISKYFFNMTFFLYIQHIFRNFLFESKYFKLSTNSSRLIIYM